jgi:hypothetical protein
VIDTDLHRRVVEYAEWFARGPGSDLRWLGTGNWTRRRLSWPIEQIERTAGWKAIKQELRAKEGELSEEEMAFRYDHWTPQSTAAYTLHLRYDMPYYVPRGVASLRTAPFPYWLNARAPKLSGEEEQLWVVHIEQELATYCELLRQVYGRPNPAEEARTDHPT